MIPADAQEASVPIDQSISDTPADVRGRQAGRAMNPHAHVSLPLTTQSQAPGEGEDSDKDQVATTNPQLPKEREESTGWDYWTGWICLSLLPAANLHSCLIIITGKEVAIYCEEM